MSNPLPSSFENDYDVDTDLIHGTFLQRELNTPPSLPYNKELGFNAFPPSAKPYQENNVTLQPEHSSPVLNNDQDQLQIQSQTTQGTDEEIQQLIDDLLGTSENGNQELVGTSEDSVSIQEIQQLIENPFGTFENGNQQLVGTPEVSVSIQEAQKVAENPRVAVENRNRQLKAGPVVEHSNRHLEAGPVVENSNWQLKAGPVVEHSNRYLEAGPSNRQLEAGPVAGEVIPVNNKRKYLYECDEPFQDPKKERKRKNACKARRIRVENKAKLEQMKKEIEDLKKSLATVAKENQEKNAEMEKLTKKLEQKEKEIEDLKESLATVAKENQEKKNAEMEKLTKKLEQKEKEIKNLKEALAIVAEENQDLKKRLGAILRVCSV